MSVCVWKVYCGKTADWIRIPFGVMSGAGRGMGVFDGVHVPQGEGVVLGVYRPLDGVFLNINVCLLYTSDAADE